MPKMSERAAEPAAVHLPSAADYTRIQIFVHPLAELDPLVLNRVLQRLCNAEVIEVYSGFTSLAILHYGVNFTLLHILKIAKNHVTDIDLVSENPVRLARAKFVTAVGEDVQKFGEFQTFRKIFGVICIGAITTEILNQRRRQPDGTVGTSAEEKKFYESLKLEYDKIKAQHSSALVSQCILFGCDNTTQFDAHELLNFPRLDDADELELGVRELIRSIYIVLESRRINNAFEKLEPAPCPTLADEEKYSVGTDNLRSKSYRRKCIGRNRKILADYALLTGLPTLALDAYDSAIDYLEQVSDYLWLAAALEGWSCAAMLIKFKDKFDQISYTKSIIRRVSTTDNAQYTRISLKHQEFSHNHQRRDRLTTEGAPVAAINDLSDFQTLAIVYHHQSSEQLAAAGDSDFAEDMLGQSGKQSSASSMSLYSDNSRVVADGVMAVDWPTIRRYVLPKIVNETVSNSLEGTSNVSLLTLPSYEGGKMSAPTSPTTSGSVLSKRQNLSVSHEDIVKRFAQALDNYSKFSFAARAQCDCIVRNVDVFIFRRAYVDAEIGFRRKNAFYMRLSVLFQLNVASSNAVSDANDYKAIYPLLYRSLHGYGLNDERIDLAGGRLAEENSGCQNGSFTPIPHRINTATQATRVNVPFAIQIKAVSEVFISASRAGLYDVAIRHICFILQNYFDYMAMDDVLEKNSELQKLVELYEDVHSLAQPISLYEQNIVLPPVELTRFPRLGEFKICSLPPHLAPTIADSEASKIFIYSPFQDRKKQRDVLWVVDCLCEVLISVSNPLPIDLVVKNLTLIVSGCKFEANPIRLNLPSCYGAEFSPRATPTVKITGVPRTPGTLMITGYSCEVLGVKTVCSLNKAAVGSKPTARPIVRVLDALPLLALETSLRMMPTADASIAEATVFSGQMLYYSIHLHNTSEVAPIDRVTIKIQQPEVCGGPNLVDVLQSLEVLDIAPGERRELRVKIFGIDPSANPTQQNAGNGGGSVAGHSSASNGGPTPHASVSSAGNLLGEEHRVYVRRNTSISIVQSEISDSSSVYSLPQSGILKTDKVDQKSTVSKSGTVTDNNNKSNSNTPVIPAVTIDVAALSNIADSVAGEGHDLIPYIGRLLSAEFIFTYTMAVSSTENERCERVARLPLAVAIVPALNVVDWHILAGDGPLTRYVVVDVTNATDVNAELTYGGDGRMMWVQPKEVCRVPLLCPCCTNISSSAFTAATQLESHMMQMREIERLRKTLEKHIARYLDIRWSIPALNLEGLVPVGSLLSSVAFLKQLVVPEMSVSIMVNDSVYVSEDDVVVGIGELIRLKVGILASTKETNVLSGMISVHCYQDLQNAQLQRLSRDENLILYGPTRVPFQIPGSGGFDVTFSFAFRYEGVHKIRPIIVDAERPGGIADASLPSRGSSAARRSILNDETVFIPFASFNVVTKA